jgi:GalNAc-alpha-(1->4)-GalNAc-alpha-(1->3)-diNAcBac-PP-undecaprenol alpha-1,4-N-acetyl-D-galactosaminyltransferase
MVNMANYWTSRGLRVTIITQSDAAAYFSLHKDVKHISLSSARSSSNIITTILRNIRTILKLRHILKDLNIETVISFMTTMNVISVIAARSLGLPVIISERYNPWKFNPPITWKVFRKRVYPYADYVVVQSIEAFEFFCKFCKKEKIKIIYNPVLIPDNTIDCYDQDNPKVILGVGRLKHVKGYDLLVEAFARLHTSDWQLWIVGEGEERSNLEKMISDLKLNDRIKLLGQSDQVGIYYQSAAIFALSSRAEGFPNSLAEAMSYGLPCISMNCETGPAVLIEHAKNGLLVPNKDISAFSAGLQYLIDEPDIRERLGAAARTTIEQKFRLDAIMKQWEDLVDENPAIS